MKMKIRIDFFGRAVGAIGVCYFFTVVREFDKFPTADEVHAELYKKFEHIRPSQTKWRKQ